MDWNRPINLSLVCLYLSFKIYISFFIIWTFFFSFFFQFQSVWQKKNKCPNNKKEIYNDKYKHTRDRLFGLGLELTIFSVVRGNHANQYGHTVFFYRCPRNGTIYQTQLHAQSPLRHSRPP